MKNILGILTAVLVLTFTATFAQKKAKPFQGTITYDITYSGTNLTPAQKAQLPATSVETIKDCKTKTEEVTGPVTQASITDGTTKAEIVLIDYMGTKYALKLTSDEITEGLAKAGIPTINITKETKVIADYKCNQAILTTKEDDGSVTVDTIYYTEEIGCKDLNFATQFKDIPGAVLEYSEFAPQIEATMYYKTKEVKKSKISDNVFLIPSDYKEVTKDELKKAFGGGGGE